MFLFPKVCPLTWVAYPPDWPTDCFYFGFSEGAPSQLNAKKARLLCNEINGTLLSIHNKEENSFISQHLNSSHIHLNGLLKYDSWVWLDGSAFKYSNFGGAEAELVQDMDEDGPEACLVLSEGGTWRTSNCTETASQYVCRYGYSKFGRDISV